MLLELPILPILCQPPINVGSTELIGIQQLGQVNPMQVRVHDGGLWEVRPAAARNVKVCVNARRPRGWVGRRALGTQCGALLLKRSPHPVS